MKITIKTITQEVFYIEAPESETVADLKRKIDVAKHFPVDAQRLVCSGHLLQDDERLGSLNLTDGKNFIIVMVSSSQRAPTPPKATKTSAVPAQSSSKQTPSQKSQTTMPPVNQSKTSSGASSVSGPSVQSKEDAVTSLVTMGFDRASAETALAACKYDTSLAAEALANSSLLPDVLRPRDSVVNIDQRAALRVVLNDPPFRDVRLAIRDYPNMLDDILLGLKESNPQMVRSIEQNKDLFLQLINEQRDDSAKKEPVKSAATPKVGDEAQEFNENDRRALAHLKAMGFADDAAKLAYLLCNKDEQGAVDFLINQDKQMNRRR